MIEQMAIAMALPGFNDLIFAPFREKIKKIYRLEV